MPFSNLEAVQTYIDSYIKTNNTNSITGLELNTSLTGIIQFMPTIGTYTSHISASGITFGSFTIPLDFTPTYTLVQSQYITSGTYPVFDMCIAVTAMPITNGIVVYYETGTISINKDVIFTYLVL